MSGCGLIWTRVGLDEWVFVAHMHNHNMDKYCDGEWGGGGLFSGHRCTRTSITGKVGVWASEVR